MFKKFTPAVIAATVLATCVSTAFAQPTPKRHDNSTVPVTADRERQDRGKSEGVTGSVFREFGW